MCLIDTHVGGRSSFVAEAEDISLQRIRILLLEDNPADMALFKIYLSEVSGDAFDVTWVQMVADAREQLDLTTEGFDIVFVDLNLPDGNGIDLVNDVAAGLNCPMILLTGNTSRDIDIEAISSGAADFLPKDIIDAEILNRTIRYSIERRQQDQDLRTSVTQLTETNQQLVSNSALREAEVANVIKLAEHLAKPPNLIEVNRDTVDEKRPSYEVMAEASAVGVWHIQPDGISLHTNAHMCRLLGIESETSPRNLSFTSQFARPDQRRAEREIAIWNSGMASSFESRFASANSDGTHDLVISGCPVLDLEGAVESIIVTVMDVSERRQSETMIRELAQKDPLTSLLNRTTFLDMLTTAVAINQRNGTHVALLYIDLDHFKAVNDSYGHQAGDEVLKLVAGKIQSCIRESDFAARIGGDEFTVALNNLESPMGAAGVAENILESIRQPWVVDGEPLNVGMSIGIAMFDDCTAQQCLQNADLALYRCKQDGGDAYQFFAPGMLEVVERRRKCEADILVALKKDEFRLHYQPQISLLDGSVTGMEALIRWERPEIGLVSPADFMDVAEDSGSIVQIGNWVARTACDQIARLPEGVPVSINISAKELHQPGLARTLMDIVEAAEISPDRLMIEVTESAVIDDLEQSARLIDEIRRYGMKVALDDFGTGYSSLSTLKQLTVDSLKIDGSFIRNICTNEVDAAIAESIVDLGRRMGLFVVAECIETAEQAERLREMRCDVAQGFFYSKPVAAHEIANWAGAPEIRVAG